MKTYSISFSHPVKGTVFLTNREKKFSHVFPAETDQDFVIKIPLDGIERGKWIINFEWEYNEHEYNCKDEIILH